MNSKMKIVSIGNATYAYENAVYISNEHSQYTYINIKGNVFKLIHSDNFSYEEIALNSLHRAFLSLDIGDELLDYQFLKDVKNSAPTPLVTLSVSIKQKSKLTITHETLLKLVHKQQFFIAKNQLFIYDFAGTNIFMNVDDFQKLSTLKHYYIDKEITNVVFKNSSPKFLQIESNESEGINPIVQILQPDFSFNKLGVGGLDGPFIENFRRTFATRLLPNSIVKELGIQNTKGLLLYGVPGCGKTRLARALSELIGAGVTKVVNGPECLDRYVGSSEQKIRELFLPAEDEYKEKGDKAKLHVIIFDEIDAICKTRGSNPNSLTDSVVNQLLTKLDGVESVPNVFVIGMTNIPEVIDKALTRPGRLELKLEIGLPDAVGRFQILEIHTKKLRDSERLNPNVDLHEITRLTQNYTGAELESVVKNAVSLAILEDPKVIDVTNDHFMQAIEKVQPNFGIPGNLLQRMIRSQRFNDHQYSTEILENIQEFLQSKHDNKKHFILSYENAINDAAHIAQLSKIPHVKYINARQMLHLWGDASKASHLSKLLDEANKSSTSLIIIDEIEKICEFIAQGKSYSSSIIHTLSTWIKSNDYSTTNKMIFLILSQDDYFINNYF